MILHLGVIDIPYSDANYQPAPKTKNPKGIHQRIRGAAKRGKSDAPAQSNQRTTGDVAVILEEKYHIMETFFEVHEDMIGDMIAQSMSDALDSLANGAPGTLNITAAATSEIEATFRMWLSQRGMDETMTAGVPTEAARRGVSHRVLHPYAKRASRPSFIDTGLFEANFHVWTDV